MFIFLNFLFFLLWFSLPGSGFKPEVEPQENKAPVSVKYDRHSEAEADSAEIADSAVIDSLVRAKLVNKPKLNLARGHQNISDYDSAEASLPPQDRDGFFTRLIKHKSIELQKVVDKNPEGFQEKFVEVFKHNIPKLNFLFLFFCSLILYLVYWRKHLYMVNHAFFAIHLACTFLLLSVLMLLLTYLPHGGWLAFVIFLYGNYFFYRSLRVVYQQSSGKTLLKFFIINMFLAFMMLASLLANVLYAALSQQA